MEGDTADLLGVVLLLLAGLAVLGAALWLTAAMARHRGRTVWFWVLMLLVFGPIAWLVLFVAGPRQDRAEVPGGPDGEG